MGLADALKKEIGVNDDLDTTLDFLSTGYPPLDYAISSKWEGGGMPVGRIVEMFGPPSSGKTAIATKVMIEAQRRKGVAFFSDHERSFEQRQAVGLGLSLDPDQFIFKRPQTFEQSISMAMNTARVVREKKLIPKEAPIVWVADSLASMVPMSKFGKNVDEFNMNDNTALARATSASFPSLNQFCETYGMLALFLNQVRTKVGVMFGDPTKTPGGDSPEFYASVRIKLGRSQIKKKVDGKDAVVGQQIGAECVKNKVSAPFRKAKWNFMFNEDGTGSFDVIGSMIDLLVEKKLLEMESKRIVWDGKTLHRSALIKQLETESDAVARLTAMIAPSSSVGELSKK